MLDAGHHLAGCLVDVVLGVVLVLVLQPALVHAVAVTRAHPLVSLLGHAGAERLQALLHHFLLGLRVDDFDVDVDLWWLHEWSLACQHF